MTTRPTAALLSAALILTPAGLAAAAAIPAQPSDRGTAYLLFFNAEQAAAAGRFEEARTLLEQVLALDPGSSDVHATLARLCVRTGDAICAEERAGRAVALDPRNADAHLVLAELDLQRLGPDSDPRVLDEAIVHLAAAAEAEPAELTTWLMWIRALAGSGRADQAADVARRAASVQGIDPAAPYLALARAYMAINQPDRAIAVLEQVNPKGRGAGPVLETLAELKASRNDRAGQAAALERLRAVRPDDPDVAYRLGVVRLELGDASGAEPPLRDAYNAREFDPQVRRDLARALVRLGRGAEALPLLSGIPALQRAPHTLMLWAQAAEQAGRFAEAADRLEELLGSLSPEDRTRFAPALRVRAAQDRLRAGSPDKALVLTEGALDDGVVLKLRVDALQALGQGAQADVLLRARIASRPDDAATVALVALRAATAHGGSQAAGVAAALAPLSGRPQRERVAAETAVWLSSWDAAPMGAALLDAVPLQENPDPAVLRARASTLYAAGRIGEAEAAYRRLLEARPDDDAALNDLGYLLVSENRHLREALTMLERASALRPDHPGYLDSLGLALLRTGRSAEALPLLLRAAQKAGEREEPTIREHLGDVYLALGDRTRARAEWNAALALGAEDPERVRRKLEESAAAPVAP